MKYTAVIFYLEEGRDDEVVVDDMLRAVRGVVVEHCAFERVHMAIEDVEGNWAVHRLVPDDTLE